MVAIEATKIEASRFVQVTTDRAALGEEVLACARGATISLGEMAASVLRQVALACLLAAASAARPAPVLGAAVADTPSRAQKRP